MLDIDRKLVFLDLETTTGETWSARPWEIAMIERWPDGEERETLIQVRDVDTCNAEPEALEVGRFEERHCLDPEAWLLSEEIAALWVARRTASTPVLGRPVLVGSAVGYFDAPILGAMLARQGLAPGWWHHPIDLVTWTQAHLAGDSSTEVSLKRAGSYDLSRLVGVDPPSEDVRHTAMGDAVWARDWWDALTKAVQA